MESPPQARGATARGWSPGWAVAVAVLGGVVTLVPLWYGIAVLVQDTSAPGQDDGFAVAVGQLAVSASVVVLALLAWFLLRGGRLPFWLGTALVATGLAWYATLFLP